MIFQTETGARDGPVSHPPRGQDSNLDSLLTTLDQTRIKSASLMLLKKMLSSWAVPFKKMSMTKMSGLLRQANERVANKRKLMWTSLQESLFHAAYTPSFEIPMLMPTQTRKHHGIVSAIAPQQVCAVLTNPFDDLTLQVR